MNFLYIIIIKINSETQIDIFLIKTPSLLFFIIKDGKININNAIK